MNITPMNNTNVNFNGKIITKGNWPKNLKKQFVENTAINNFANNSKSDIIGIMSAKTSSKYDIYHDPGERLFKLTLVTTKEKPSIIETIKNALGIYSEADKQNITHAFHREEKMSNIIDNIEI